MSFVPNIGFVLAVIPPFLVTLLESGFWTAVVVLLLDHRGQHHRRQPDGASFHEQERGSFRALMGFLSLILWLGAGRGRSAYLGAHDADGEAAVLRLLRKHASHLGVHGEECAAKSTAKEAPQERAGCDRVGAVGGDDRRGPP